ncbi:hypothetical protein glysoja_031865 [Glycine soja]|uniref:Uncharacterized protein n=1 Tax=Glycine soja TaxID=3848 RepID=A0A0B2SIW6_GLYSO|nr:hypothetical protein glysoja_031865 [Glycine soja]
MKIPFYFSVLLLLLLIDSGNQVHMAVVPEHVHCENLILRNDYCDLENDPCNAHCKLFLSSACYVGRAFPSLPRAAFLKCS